MSMPQKSVVAAADFATTRAGTEPWSISISTTIIPDSTSNTYILYRLWGRIISDFSAMLPAWMMRDDVTMYFNTLRPRQNERHFADDIFK